MTSPSYPENASNWWEQPLADLSEAQWEEICDGCGKCCLHKLEDTDSKRVYYTAVACRFLDPELVKCRCYPEREEKNPDCLIITPVNLSQLSEWLPETCAYKLRHNGQPLPGWHPIFTGSGQSVAESGQSVRFRCISEQDIREDADWEELVLVDLI